MVGLVTRFFLSRHRFTLLVTLGHARSAPCSQEISLLAAWLKCVQVIGQWLLRSLIGFITATWQEKLARNPPHVSAKKTFWREKAKACPFRITASPLG